MAVCLKTLNILSILFISMGMCRGGEYTATDAVLQLETELAAAGYNAPMTSLFRGTRVCVLPAPVSTAPAAEGGCTDAELQKLVAQRLRQTVRSPAS